jgi:hypothetical protein
VTAAPSDLAYLLAGLAALGLVAAALAVNFNHRANRLFAIMWALWGLWDVGLGLSGFAGESASGFWARVIPYFALPFPFAALAFGLEWPRRLLPRVPGLPAATLAVGALLGLAYAADHGLFRSAGGPGPLGQLQALTFAPVVAVLAAAWMRAFLRDPQGRRPAMLLMAIAWGFLSVWYSLVGAVVLSIAAREVGPFAPTIVLSDAIAIPFALVFLVGLARLARSGEEAVARTARRGLALVGVVVAAGAASGTALLAGGGIRDLGSLFTGSFELLASLLMWYALLRHQLFDIQLRVRWTIRQSTVAAAFIGVFFVVSESASTFLSASGLGPYLGIAAAGLLVFALAPLQRAAERVADRAMPGVKPAGQMSHGERARVYLDAARTAWADGVLIAEERELLDRLGDSLGLSADEARRLESEARRGGAAT